MVSKRILLFFSFLPSLMIIACSVNSQGVSDDSQTNAGMTTTPIQLRNVVESQPSATSNEMIAIDQHLELQSLLIFNLDQISAQESYRSPHDINALIPTSQDYFNINKDTTNMTEVDNFFTFIDKSNTAKSNTFSIDKLLAIFISIFALLVSLFNTYWNHKQKNTDRSRSMYDEFWFRKVFAEPLINKHVELMKLLNEKNNIKNKKFNKDYTKIKQQIENQSSSYQGDNSADIENLFSELFDNLEDNWDIDYRSAISNYNTSFYDLLKKTHEKFVKKLK